MSAGLGGVVSLAGAVLLWLALGTRRLLRSGLVSVGELTACTRQPVGEGSVRVQVEYRFTAPDGRQRSGRSRAPRMDLRDGELPGAGTPVLVLHHGRRHVVL